MFKKLVLLFISLFLISPIAFADDSSIVPVVWLFAKNGIITDINTITSIREHEAAYTSTIPLKTYVFNDNTIREYETSYTSTIPLKTYVFNDNTIREHEAAYTSTIPLKTYVLHF